MTKASKNQVEIIPIDEIIVANPRVRNSRIHQEITDNISSVGLKRPITVRRLPHGEEKSYALVCGQGRLESCKSLGHEHIPAIVVDANEEVGHVMSIVENIARRTPRASETIEQVTVLRARGYSDAEVGKKIGCSASWVNNVATLLERGEKRLLAATEAGHVPLHVAVQISRASETEAQQLLHDAYERGDLKGKKISVMRRILDHRMRSGKRHGPEVYGAKNPSRHLSPEDLAKLYQRNTDEHKRIQKKAEHAQESLMLSKQIFKELFTSTEFCALLKAEKLTSVPQPLAENAQNGGLF